MPRLFAAIIAGGRGERFWPASRSHRPKHLLPIVGRKPMLAQTLERIRPLVGPANTYIITSAKQAAAVRALAVSCGIPRANVVVEPVGRDTAPAVALAAALVTRRDPKGVLAVLPSDHVIHDAAAYRRDLKAAFEAAVARGAIVTIGIKPTAPATGFGYIRRGKSVGHFGKNRAYAVREFCEKPGLATARRYLRSGDYLWNAGMFVWTASVANAELERHAPKVYAAFAPLRVGAPSGAIAPLLRRIYARVPRISLDYAVMEKSRNVIVLPARFDWDDVGDWPAVARHRPSDAHGNVSEGTVVIEQGRNNIVQSADGHLVAVLGVDDLVIVHTPDATLVCPRSRAQEIKVLLSRMAADRGLARWL